MQKPYPLKSIQAVKKGASFVKSNMVANASDGNANMLSYQHVEVYVSINIIAAISW